MINDVPLGVLDEIAVSGFKAIRDRARVKLRPLTILAGANNSGKSSVMQPLLLLKQTLESRFDSGPLKLKGPYVTFSDSREFMSKTARHTVSEFDVELGLLSDESVALRFGHRTSGELEIREARYTRDGRPVALHENMTDAQIAALGILRGRPRLGWRVVRDRCFLYLDHPEILPHPASLVGVDSALARVIYLPANRSNSARFYPAAAEADAYSGSFLPFVAARVHRWQKPVNGRYLDRLRKDLEHLGLTREVRSEPVSEVEFEIRVGRTMSSGRDDTVNIADVGLGIAEVLPVLVALHAAQPGQLVYLEDPESHLHPRAQSRMALVLANAAKRDARIVLETHSSLLIRGIQTLVAQGDLPADKVALHWFERDEHGFTKVTSRDLDSRGRTLDWPADFDDVEIESETEYLDAVSAARKR